MPKKTLDAPHLPADFIAWRDSLPRTVTGRYTTRALQAFFADKAQKALLDAAGAINAALNFYEEGADPEDETETRVLNGLRAAKLALPQW